MRRRNATTVWTALLVAVAAAAVSCGNEPAPAGKGSGAQGSQDSSAGAGSSSGPSGRIDSRLVYFAKDLGVPHDLHTVVRTEKERALLPGWFAGARVDAKAEREIEAKTMGTDLKRNALVAYVTTTGCSQAGSTQLLADGDRLSVRLVDRPKPPSECLRPYKAVSVFEVPLAKLPKHPVFGSERDKPDPASPGELAAFTRLDKASAAGPEKKAEVTEPGALKDFLSALPSGTDKKVRSQLAKAGPEEPGERRFAFTLTGCKAKGADLAVSRKGLAASPSGGENVRCLRAERYVAVFSLPRPLVPEQPLGPKF
ncbi:hypothetical protein [Wenjunlia tyrosinilytica]|nr:hypothetical protein [Wenjunlia tyrosinilytica]